MAKLVKTWENGIEKYELTFMGETYDYSMIPCDGGSKGDKPGFDRQFLKRHPEFEEEEDLLEALDWISFEDDPLDILEELEGWEG